MSHKIYLVVEYSKSHGPGLVYACFADKDAAIDFKDRYHPNNTNVEERTLLYGQQISIGGYIE